MKNNIALMNAKNRVYTSVEWASLDKETNASGAGNVLLKGPSAGVLHGFADFVVSLQGGLRLISPIDAERLLRVQEQREIAREEYRLKCQRCECC